MGQLELFRRMNGFISISQSNPTNRWPGLPTIWFPTSLGLEERRRPGKPRTKSPRKRDRHLRILKLQGRHEALKELKKCKDTNSQESPLSGNSAGQGAKVT